MKQCNVDGCDRPAYKAPNYRAAAKCMSCLDYWKKFKIHTPDRDRMLSDQNGRCAICEDDLVFKKGGASVDHCHRTGRVRGLLCKHCNVGLGHFRDNVSRLENAIRYLEEE